jgi:arylsulfatase A-like enzyme
MLSLAAGCGTGPGRPNVVLIIIDTLRADHLGCYGYGRDTSPSMDSLAASGTLWSSVTSQSTWTLPSIASIYTGLSVRSHGVCMTRDWMTWGMDPEMPTLVTVLASNGYSTGGFVNVYLISERLGFHRGFQNFHVNYMGHGMAGETVDEFLRWRGDDDSGKPFLAVIHLYDVHSPYEPPPPYDEYFTGNGATGLSDWTRDSLDGAAVPEEREHLEGLYDGEIRWVDSQVARVFQWLRSSGEDANTIVIITADHGEAFLEREGRNGILHRSLFQEVVHVPLIMAGPGIPSGIVDQTPAGLFDIMPTLLEELGIDHSLHLDGVSLLNGAPADGRPIPTAHLKEAGVAVTCDGIKVVWFAIADSSCMYDLFEDPMERVPLPADSAYLDMALEFWATPCGWDPVPRDSAEVKSMLRNLGYL